MFGRGNQPPPHVPKGNQALDTAWRIHGATGEWTARVDAKASFALALETAILAGITTLSDKDRSLGQLDGWKQLLPYWLGIGFLVFSALWTLRVVAPQLRGSSTKEESKVDFIYFGHLRHWRPDDLEQALNERELLPVLSRQLVRMSAIAWTKHRRLQVSLWCGVIGTALVAMAGAAHSWQWI